MLEGTFRFHLSSGFIVLYTFLVFSLCLKSSSDRKLTLQASSFTKVMASASLANQDIGSLLEAYKIKTPSWSFETSAHLKHICWSFIYERGYSNSQWTFKKVFNITDHSVQFSHSVMSDSLWPREPQHARPPCPSPTPRVHPNPCPLSWWCHPTILSSIISFSSCPQSFPASGSFPMSQLFAWGGQNIRASASASILPVNTQDWSPLGWTGWISLHSKGLSRVFSNTTVQKHQFFSAQLSL